MRLATLGCGGVDTVLFFHCLELQGRRGEGTRGVRVINPGEEPLRLPLPPTPLYPPPPSLCRKKPGSERMGENKEPLEDVAVISLSV